MSAGNTAQTDLAQYTTNSGSPPAEIEGLATLDWATLNPRRVRVRLRPSRISTRVDDGLDSGSDHRLG